MASELEAAGEGAEFVSGEAGGGMESDGELVAVPGGTGDMVSFVDGGAEREGGGFDGLEGEAGAGAEGGDGWKSPRLCSMTLPAPKPVVRKIPWLPMPDME